MPLRGQGSPSLSSVRLVRSIPVLFGPLFVRPVCAYCQGSSSIPDLFAPLFVRPVCACGPAAACVSLSAHFDSAAAAGVPVSGWVATASTDWGRPAGGSSSAVRPSWGGRPGAFRRPVDRFGAGGRGFAVSGRRQPVGARYSHFLGRVRLLSGGQLSEDSGHSERSSRAERRPGGLG